MNVSSSTLLLSIQHKIAYNQNSVTRSNEKLASGLKITQASDDASGVKISEKMRAQIRGLNTAVDNATDGISMIQTAEGGLSNINDLLHRMRELSIKAANGVYSSQDIENISIEFEECKEEINRIAQTTTFNGKQLLNTNSGTVSVIKGAQQASNGTKPANCRDKIDFSTVGDGTVIKVNHGDTTYQFEFTYDTSLASKDSIGIKLDGTETNRQKAEKLGEAIERESGGTINADIVGHYPDNQKQYTLSIFTDVAIAGETLSLDYETHAPQLKIGNAEDDVYYLTFRSMNTRDLGVNNISIENTTDANNAILAIDNAINKVTEQRANLGSTQNSIEYIINRLTVESENTQASESRIRDVDMAKEMVSFVKGQIIQDSSISMLSQANQTSDDVLQLITQ